MDTPAAKPVVLVTGGSGLLGRRIIERLRPNYQVVSLDLVGDPLVPPDVEFICLDVTSDDSVSRVLDRVEATYGSQVASIVHLVAYYDFSGADSPLYDKITVEGTRRLLEATKTLELEQFLFTSTLLVHKPTRPGEITDEASPLEPSWAYPASKVRTEEVIRSQDRGFSTVILRLAGAYDEDGNSPPLTNQVRRIHGKALTSRFYPAPLDRGQPFVHLDDAVDSVIRAVDRRGELPGDLPLLIGEPTTLSYGEVQDIIGREIHGGPWRTMYIPPALARPGAWLMERNPLVEDPFMATWSVGQAADHYELDITQARLHLDWEPRHRLRDALPRMVQQLKADPAGWYARNELKPPRRAPT